MDILSMESLARNGSQKNRRHVYTNLTPENANKRKTKYIKLYELTDDCTYR